AGNGLLQPGPAVPHNGPKNFGEEYVARWRTSRVQQRIQLLIHRRSAGVRFTVKKRVPVEVDIRFVYSPQPRLPIRVQNVDQHQSPVRRNRREGVHELQLYCRSSKSLDSVESRRMQQKALRLRSPEPCDVDAEIFIAGAFAIQGQSLKLSPETSSGFSESR